MTHATDTTVFHHPGAPTLIMHRVYCYEIREHDANHTAHFHAGDNQWLDLARGTKAQAFAAVYSHIETLPPPGVAPHQWQ